MLLKINVTKANNLPMISPFLFGQTNDEHSDYQE